MKDRILFEEDFKGFLIGEFPYDRDHSAAGEYHCVVPEGYRGAWTDQVCNFRYNGHGPSWIITGDNGKHYMEQCRIEKGLPHRIFPTLQTGSSFWKDYDVSVTIRRLSTKGMAGLAFCMNDSIDTLVLSMEYKDRIQLAYRHKEEVKVLKSVPFPTDADSYYTLKAAVDGDTVRCMVNGETLFHYSGKLVERGGKIGITADCPTQFTDIAVMVEEEKAEEIKRAETEDQLRLQNLQAPYPSMKLWKKIDLKNFGTSRQIRFGHLTGTKEWFMVIPQAQKRVERDSYSHISCLTAIDLDGNILWQRGEPSEISNVLGKISADLPCQVYDIDGDGIDEVITAHNFELQILDGRTGEIKKSAPTPLSEEEDETIIGLPYNMYAFDRINPDGIRIANFRGLGRPADILIKDRYCRVYALDSDLNVMWKYQSSRNTGHFPLALDINGDGCDEVLVGYTLLDCNGTPLWSYPIYLDHTDEIVAGKFKRNSEKGYFACVSGTQGFFIGDFQGNIVTRDYIGHAQRISIGNYAPERPGFEIAVTNFWGHQGVIYLYDDEGNLLWEKENERNGNILAPVNWLGNGVDFFLTNADPEKGGLMDGHGDIAVPFPDDGHPVMCCEAIDLCGDDRDELVVWDYHGLFIYTQSDGERETTCHPVKYPFYNASNYRGEFSFPDRSYITFCENPKEESK
ncbi:hypothetical protein [Clostridium sp. Marseille-P2415]|uniref:hypothetical protein n=1 Tax=Clostridium sp. Marseille-P2415 TaxID=1805471 RepID=UPI00190EF4AC|nr:hypothetical protein [Clostridium sp. Marseille-P2415]